ncbi:MAG: carboxypeptidase regulatory-like domain-containing protein, partial [Thermoplasmata archaeon]
GESESELGMKSRRERRKRSKRELYEEEPRVSQTRLWLKQNWLPLTLLLLIFLFGLLLRSYYYYPPATENGYILSGNDPYYHKRVVDYVQDEHEHLIFDPLLSYPDGALNPRPPLFDWSVAIFGLLLAPFFGGDVSASTWHVMLFSPSFWGALTVFPVYLIGKEMFNKKAGVICAFLVATMPSHVERSPLGFSDHDAIVLFFVVLSFYFFIRALNTLVVRDKWVENWRAFRDIPKGFKEWFRYNQKSVAFAVLAGMSLASIALIWKGFLYPVVIIIVYFFIQVVLNKLRNKDSLGVSLVTIISLAITALLPVPYYYGNSMNYVIEPAMEILLAVIVVSAVLVPTRDSPWLLVFSVLAAIMISGILLLMYVFPDIGSTYFSGQGYFAENKVFSTIAEAQAPDYSRAMFSYGVVTTFLALFALVLSIVRVAKDLKAHYLFLTIWGVTAVYMAVSATRFIFNAGPIFAIMSGWMVYAIVQKLDFRKMLKHYRSLKGGGYFYALKKSVKVRHIVGVLFLAFMIVLPNVWLGWDAGVPFGEKKSVDVLVYDTLPDFMKPEEYDSDEAGNKTRYPDGVNTMYNRTNLNELKYFGAFGHGFPADYWLDGMRWLSEQDTELPIEERPGFISWWDYGFWAIYLGQHPTAADNFQGRVQYAGSFISAKNESEGIALLIARLLEATRANYVKDHGEARLTDGVREVLVKHLGQEKADEIEDVVDNPTKYKKEVLDNPGRYGYYSSDLVADVTPIYAVLQRWIPEMMDDDEMTWLLHDLQEETEWNLRYFAIDSRLFPYGPQNTGIFYAPLKLSDHRINEDNEPYDYLRTIITAGGRQYTLEEFKEAREDNPNIEVTDYKLEYYEPFLGSMLLKCYLGYTLEEIGTSDTSVANVEPNLPAVHSTNYFPMQGWMMRHFRLVYRTAYWNPYNQTEYKFHPEDWIAMSDIDANDKVRELEEDGIDNDGNGVVDDRGEGGVVTSGLRSGVVFLKYYEGAYLNGTVTTYNGTPIPNVRVTVHDEYSIPHDTMLTDENGSYHLLAPPGNVSVIVSSGGFGDDQYAPYKRLSLVETNNLNRTNVNISDDQAMRRQVDEDSDGIWDYYITQDFQVAPNSLEGRMFWDNNSNGMLDGDDLNISYGQVIAQNLDLEMNLTAETDENGLYKFNELMPGNYNLSYDFHGHIFDLEDTISVTTRAQEKKDIPIRLGRIEGSLFSSSVGVMTGEEVQLFDKINTTTVTTVTDSEGNFTFHWLPIGNYTLLVELDGYDTYEEDIDLGLSEVAKHNITLATSTYVEGNTTIASSGSILANVTILFEGYDESAGITRLAASNETGYYAVNLRDGSYLVSAKHDIGEDTPFIYIGRLDAQGGQITHNVALERSVEFHGTVYFDYNNNGSIDGLDIRQFLELSFESAKGTLTSITNSKGFYRVYLPVGDYTMYVHEDSAILNETFSLIEELSVTQQEAVEYDIELDMGQMFMGSVHHDKNGDGTWEVSEGLGPAEVTFTNERGLTIDLMSDENGQFSINLPKNEDYNLTIVYPDFETLILTDMSLSEL